MSKCLQNVCHYWYGNVVILMKCSSQVVLSFWQLSVQPVAKISSRWHFRFCDLTEASTWWRHQMKTFSALLAICAGNSPVPGEFPTQRPVTRSFDVYFDLRLNKRLSKHSWGWWFETLSCSLWRHRNDISKRYHLHLQWKHSDDISVAYMSIRVTQH